MITAARPLYQQVQDALTARIADGDWKAGEALPSEFALAAELGVSQGTVRKALNEMAAQNLLDRHQGRGTYVPEHTEARALFHFFRMEDRDGHPITPQPMRQEITQVSPPPEVAAALDTGRRKIWRINRLRGIAGAPAIVEHIYLDPRRLPGLRAETALPNALYSYYQSAAGITVARADDRLTADAASAELAQALKTKKGAPLLAARRIARDIRGTAVEYRLSWFRTDLQGYAVTLR